VITLLQAGISSRVIDSAAAEGTGFDQGRF
jgi:hypothetical protein